MAPTVIRKAAKETNVHRMIVRYMQLGMTLLLTAGQSWSILLTADEDDPTDQLVGLFTSRRYRIRRMTREM
jgi:hypothetical protein